MIAASTIIREPEGRGFHRFREHGLPVANGQGTTVRRKPFNNRGFGWAIGRLVLLVEWPFGLDFPDFEAT
jgi:hypothetical protein